MTCISFSFEPLSQLSIRNYIVPVKLFISGLAKRNKRLISPGLALLVFAAACSLTSSRTMRVVENECRKFGFNKLLVSFEGTNKACLLYKEGASLKDAHLNMMYKLKKLKLVKGAIKSTKSNYII